MNFDFYVYVSLIITNIRLIALICLVFLSPIFFSSSIYLPDIFCVFLDAPILSYEAHTWIKREHSLVRRMSSLKQPGNVSSIKYSDPFTHAAIVWFWFCNNSTDTSPKTFWKTFSSESCCPLNDFEPRHPRLFSH